MKIKILNAVESLDSSYGGPANSVPNLCLSLNNIDGVSTVLFSLDDENAGNIIIESNNLTWYKKRYIGPSKIKYSANLIKHLKNLVIQENIDIIHVHNLWNYFSYACYKAAIELNIPLVFSIRGSLYPWSLSQRAFMKKSSWRIFQRKALLTCERVHVTCDDEKFAVENLIDYNKFILLSNGVEIPNNIMDKNEAREILDIPIDKKCFLFLSRIHPKKGIDYLLRALVHIKDEVIVLIVGPVTDEKYYLKCKKMLNDIPSNIKVTFVKEVDSITKWKYYSASDLFILPSHTENFGIVIAEALVSGTPVLTTKNTPWNEINHINAGYCIDLNDNNVLFAMNDFLSLNVQEQIEMGERGSHFVRKNFLWSSIAEEMNKHYCQILESKC
ncbi:glycosyltransferase [Photobacterium damselae]|uniref:glycosyltransferase n=1 Tax=Photobacterium damselae TaxID=38293 RepID=UPI003D7D7C8E